MFTYLPLPSLLAHPVWMPPPPLYHRRRLGALSQARTCRPPQPKIYCLHYKSSSLLLLGHSTGFIVLIHTPTAIHATRLLCAHHLRRTVSPLDQLFPARARRASLFFASRSAAAFMRCPALLRLLPSHGTASWQLGTLLGPRALKHFAHTSHLLSCHLACCQLPSTLRSVCTHACTHTLHCIAPLTYWLSDASRLGFSFPLPLDRRGPCPPNSLHRS